MTKRCITVSHHALERIATRFPEWDRDSVLYCINHIATLDKSWMNNSHMLRRAYEENQDPLFVYIYKEIAFLIKNKKLITILHADWLTHREQPVSRIRLYKNNSTFR